MRGVIGIKKARPGRRRFRSREELAQCGLIGVAVAREQMRVHMIDFSIALFMRDDGADAGDLLAHLAWVLAIGSEIAASKEFGSPLAKRLHAALRTVIQMSTSGNRWQASQAGVMKDAAADAKTLISSNPIQPAARRDDAEWLASRVLAGVSTLADVAGSEIYAAQPAEKAKA